MYSHVPPLEASKPCMGPLLACERRGTNDHDHDDDDADADADAIAAGSAEKAQL